MRLAGMIKGSQQPEIIIQPTIRILPATTGLDEMTASHFDLINYIGGERRLAMPVKYNPEQIAKGFVILIGIVMAIFFWIKSFLFDTQKAVPHKPQAQDADSPCITQKGHFGAFTETLLDQVSAMIENKDTEAAAKLMAQSGGRILILKGGDPVFVEERNIMSGKIKIRPKGQTFSLWTHAEAVNCP